VAALIQSVIRETLPGVTADAQVLISPSYRDKAYITAMAAGLAEKNSFKLARLTYRTVSCANSVNVTVVSMFKKP